MHGVIGKLLRINLDQQCFSAEPLDEATLRKYVGSRGLGGSILFNEVGRGVDPLGSENKLIFVTGPLCGLVPGGTRTHLISKSPLTNGYGESNAGGSFSTQLKRAGFDSMIIEGVASEPIFLWVANERVEFRSANHIWGNTTGQAEDRLKKETDARAAVAVIGPAGERKARIAAVLHEKHRAFGRTGMGAVMGAKNLKAVVVRGTRRLTCSSPSRMKKLIRELIQRLKKDPGINARKKYGTACGILPLNELGALPTQNFQAGIFAGCEKISGEKMYDTILKGRFTCLGCPVKCIRSVEVADGPFAPVDPKYGGPEYEGMASLGSICLNSNLRAIAKAHELCNALGIDTISTGVVVAWAMECYEKGILSKENLDGIKLTWGNAKAVVELVRKIGLREGVGALLSEGVRIASKEVGNGSSEFAMHVKGLEMAIQEPRVKKGQGFGYAVGPRGAAHTEVAPEMSFEKENAYPELGIISPVSRFETGKRKAYYASKGQEIRVLLELSGACGFVLGPWSNVSSLTVLKDSINAATGWDCSLEELISAAIRAINIARAFNIREGMSDKDDILPKRMAEPLKEGASKGQTFTPRELAVMREEYYRLRGWSNKGIPTRKTLKGLGLHYIAAELEQEGIIPEKER